MNFLRSFGNWKSLGRWEVVNASFKHNKFPAVYVKKFCTPKEQENNNEEEVLKLPNFDWGPEMEEKDVQNAATTLLEKTVWRPFAVRALFLYPGWQLLVNKTDPNKVLYFNQPKGKPSLTVFSSENSFNLWKDSNKFNLDGQNVHLMKFGGAAVVFWFFQREHEFSNLTFQFPDKYLTLNGEQRQMFKVIQAAVYHEMLISKLGSPLDVKNKDQASSARAAYRGRNDLAYFVIKDSEGKFLMDEHHKLCAWTDPALLEISLRDLEKRNLTVSFQPLSLSGLLEIQMGVSPKSRGINFNSESPLSLLWDHKNVDQAYVNLRHLEIDLDTPEERAAQAKAEERRKKVEEEMKDSK